MVSVNASLMTSVRLNRLRVGAICKTQSDSRQALYFLLLDLVDLIHAPLVTATGKSRL